MSRVFPFGRHLTVAVLFLCVLALTLCQVLGPTARMKHDLAPFDAAGHLLVAESGRGPTVSIPLPSRCASIKLAPVQIIGVEHRTAATACADFMAFSAIPPRSIGPGVPTPPPRQV